MSPGMRGTTISSERAFLDRARAHLPELLRFARRLARNAADAEDLVQETLVRALAKRADLRDATQLKPWLLAVERTTWLNSRRGLRQRLEVLDGGLSSQERREPAGDLEREILDRSMHDELLAGLEALPEEWREALWLREVEELSYEEIAGVVGCPIGTVRSRLARARAALAGSMSREGRRGV